MGLKGVREVAEGWGGMENVVGEEEGGATGAKLLGSGYGR